jgi:hypothetical protein
LTQAAREDFAAWAGDVVTLLPSVHDFVVGNEPEPEQVLAAPVRPRGREVALLAQTYDAIKTIRPRSTVYGRALAPRGIDRAGTRRDTHSPTQFILDMGAAYRASGRATPIMNAFAFHPHADASNVPPSLAHPDSTSIGIADHPKLVSLLGQAFDGTAQRGSKLPILYDEFGVESQIPPAKEPLYTGSEPATVHPVDEVTQAAFYEQALQLTFCQPTVIGLLLFHYVDERARPGWQSGVYYVDGMPKTSLVRVRQLHPPRRRRTLPDTAADAEADGCNTGEAALARDADVKPRRALHPAAAQRIGGKTPRLVLKGTLVGRKSTAVPVGPKLASGRYRWLARATATQNAGPARSVTSRTFTIR